MSADPRIKPVAAIRTAPLFDIVVDLNPKLNIGDGPLGRRILFGAAGGTFEGPRLRGEVVPGGGDWALFRELRTEMTNPATRHRVDPSRYYFRTNPLFETGAEQYAWMNDIVCVGSGYLVEGGIAYSISQVI